MPRNALTILMVWFIAARAVIGGISPDGVLCLGGGHDHAPDPASKVCAPACSHSQPALATDEHDDGCSCVDVTVSEDEYVKPRGDDTRTTQAPPMPFPAFIPAVTIEALASGCASRAPPWRTPLPTAAAPIIASTRLNL